MGRTFLLNALQFQASAYYDCLAPKLLLPLVQGADSGGVQHLWLVFEPVSDSEDGTDCPQSSCHSM